LNTKQENNLLETMSEGNPNLYDPSDPLKFKNVSLFKEQDRNKYNDFCKVFSEFLYSEHKCWIFEKYPKYFIYYVINNLSENIRRRLFFSYEQVNGKSVLMISKLEESEKKIKMEELLGTKYEEVNKKKGVKKLFDAMIRKKSVLIGHNFNLDVLFIISHFGDSLPHTLKEYKEMLKKYFSKIYDTKYLFENLRQEYKEFKLENENTNLEAIYTHLKTLSNNLNVSIDIHEEMRNCYNTESTAYHEASFDAFVTGCAFLWMTHLTENKTENHSNRMYLMRSIYSCFNLNAEENYLIPDV
jgi:hypothetical protein